MIQEEKRSDYPDFNNDEFPIQLDDNFINNIMDNQIENENQEHNTFIFLSCKLY